MLYYRNEILAMAVVYEGHLPEGTLLDKVALAQEVLDVAHLSTLPGEIILSPHTAVRVKRADETAFFAGTYMPADELPAMLQDCLEEVRATMLANGEVPGPMALREMKFKSASRIAGTVWVGMQVRSEGDERPRIIETGEVLVQRGHEAFYAGDYAAAAKDFEKALAAGNTKFPLEDLYFSLGEALTYSGRGAEANQRYQKTLEINPKHWTAWKALGRNFRDSGDPDQAVDCYQKALVLKPDHAPLHADLGRVYLDRGEAEKGLPSLEKAAALNPQDGKIHASLALCYAMLNRFKQANAALKRASALGVDNPVEKDKVASLAARHEQADKGSEAPENPRSIFQKFLKKK